MQKVWVSKFLAYAPVQLIGITTLFLSLLTGCFDENTRTLRLGTNLWPGYEPLYLARDLGHYDKKKIKLVEFVSASEVLRGFRNGTIDAAAITLDEALLLRDSGIKFKIILVTDVSEGGDVILGRNDFKQFSDLVGKVIGVEGTALGAYVLTRALELNGLSISDIQVKHLAINEHEAAFADGRVDAVVTFDPVRTNLLRDGGKELFTSREIPGEIVDVLVVREGLIAAHRHHVAQLIHGWFRALKYFDENPEDAARRMDFRQKLGIPRVLDSYTGLRLPNRAQNIQFLTGGEPRLAAVAVRLMDSMISNSLLKSSVRIDDMFVDHIPGLSKK